MDRNVIGCLLVGLFALGCDSKESSQRRELVSASDLLLFSPMPEMENLLADLHTPEPFDYIELRRTQDQGSIDPKDSFQVVSSAGEPCAGFEYDASCGDSFDALTVDSGFRVACLPGACFHYLALQKNGSYATVVDLVPFLGKVDTIGEAALIAYANGYDWHTDGGDLLNGGIRTIDEGYQLLVAKMTEFCDPIVTTRYLLWLHANGEIEVIGTEIAHEEYGVCI